MRRRGMPSFLKQNGFGFPTPMMLLLATLVKSWHRNPVEYPLDPLPADALSALPSQHPVHPTYPFLFIQNLKFSPVSA